MRSFIKQYLVVYMSILATKLPSYSLAAMREALTGVTFLFCMRGVTFGILVDHLCKHDRLALHQEAVDDVVAKLLRPLVDQDLSLVFYDLTTIRAAGLSEQEGDVRQYDMAKEGLIARQFMLGVVQTAEGLPIYHEVFDGNQAESPTLMPTLGKVLARFGHIKRLIVVADRGLLSLDNIEELGKINLPSGQALEFILALPGRRYGEFVEVLQDFQARAVAAKQEIIEEVSWQGLRLVVAHHPQRALEQTQLRRERIAALEAQAQAWVASSMGKTAGKPGAAGACRTAAPRRACITRSKRRIWQRSSKSI